MSCIYLSSGPFGFEFLFYTFLHVFLRLNTLLILLLCTTLPTVEVIW